ncbi:hypothetical protein ACFQZ4_27695 [Catellatospora coxensis]
MIDRIVDILRETAEAVVLPRFRNLAEGRSSRRAPVTSSRSPTGRPRSC